MVAVRKGLGEAGLVQSKDFVSELRWASNDADRLPGLANDLVQRRVARSELERRAELVAAGWAAVLVRRPRFAHQAGKLRVAR